MFGMPVINLLFITLYQNYLMLRCHHIHLGNTPGDTQGCLLPGTERLIDKVTNSVIMYKKIKNILKKEGISKFNITITSCYVDGSR